MADEIPGRVTVLEELVSTETGLTRHFTFEPSGMWEQVLHPEFGTVPSLTSMWQVMLGDLGILVCNHKPGKLNKLFIAKPNFVELYREFDTLKATLSANGVEATEPVLCWLRGLIHAFMAENPNPVNCSVVMTGTSSNRR